MVYLREQKETKRNIDNKQEFIHFLFRLIYASQYGDEIFHIVKKNNVISKIYVKRDA